ncbi:TetR/AcrR family transcriptional regulator [Streptomyces sp. NPDC052051]|uniref:TetR/AcrR family transcriptional regulator n=1 Tax=Streptomyces sp. NPDC052051 TaxID=3154649 RepID=UPI003432EC0C
MASTSPAPAKPGRPRDRGADERILRAVVDELAENGVAGFTINSVAARAKVAKRTLYSRWPERDDLIVAGLSTLSVPLRAPRTGSLAEDMRILYDAVAETLDSPRWVIAARCSIELPDYPDLYAVFRRDCVDQQLAVVVEVLDDARERGELRPGVDVAVAAESFAAAIAGFCTYLARLRGVSPQGVRDRFLDMFLHGLCVDTQAQPDDSAAAR